VSITVVIPTHNRVQLLDQTLSSLCAQTEREFRIVVVDHASDEDIKGLCARYQDDLALTYHWLPKEKDAPGLPRHAGMQLVETQQAVFLDCGIVVPTFFLAGHQAFHRQHPHYVGVGLYHGYTPWRPQDERWPQVLARLSIDEAITVLDEQPDMADERHETDLEHSHFAWAYGWTGNLSLRTDDYWSVGGFDLELEYALEDLDLAYRLFCQGVKFGLVENGWAIHLPHSRPPAKVLRRMKYLGCAHCYQKSRSLSWEVILYTGVDLKSAAETFRYLSELGQEMARWPVTAAFASRYQFARPSLLLGGRLQDAACYDYLALADEQIEATSALWSCCGLRIPLADQTLRSVVVTEIWKYLNCAFNKSGVTLLECMIIDLQRTTQRAFFLDRAEHISAREQTCSVAELERLCRRYDLAFEVLTTT
jgi:GT2 family glycosyltransferase